MEKIKQAVGVLLSLQLPHQEPFVTQGTSSYSLGCTETEQDTWRSTSSFSRPKVGSKQLKIHLSSQFFWICPSWLPKVEIHVLLGQCGSALDSAPFPLRETSKVSPPPKFYPVFSCPDHCRGMEDTERGQDYLLCLLHGVPLPWQGANLQQRPQRCWQPIIPTVAANIAYGTRGNSTWGLQAGFAALEGQ